MWAVRRLLLALASVWSAVTISFIVMRLLPGDAISAQLIVSGASPEVIAGRRSALGLDRPAVSQYIDYLRKLARGDLGESLVSGQPVSEILAGRLSSTLTLTAAALLIAVPLGTALGLLTVKRGTVQSRIAWTLSSFAISLPPYWAGTLLLVVFVGQLRLLPAAYDGTAAGLILPAAALGFGSAGAVARVTAAGAAAAYRADFTRTAFGKGLRESSILFKHVLPASLTPMLSVIGLQMGYLLGGAVIIESIFTLPGIGRVMISSVLEQDYPVVQGVMLWSALAVVGAQLCADALIWLCDPRLREAVW
jgi:ABC-type dipeptide/oligopeptide/nickel transport system permease component